MESFAEQWFEANNAPFANPDAAFTLSYAILMLNTDQHNPNSKKQNTPMTVNDFRKNLKGPQLYYSCLETFYFLVGSSCAAVDGCLEWAT